MKKKILNVCALVALAAVLVLNIAVVTDNSPSSVLKWNWIGKVLAGGDDSGSSSSSSTTTQWFAKKILVDCVQDGGTGTQTEEETKETTIETGTDGTSVTTKTQKTKTTTKTGTSGEQYACKGKLCLRKCVLSSDDRDCRSRN